MKFGELYESIDESAFLYNVGYEFSNEDGRGNDNNYTIISRFRNEKDRCLYRVKREKYNSDSRLVRVGKLILTEDEIW